MSTIEESIDIDVPVHVAYNQWTQFETFPRFVDGVKRVDQIQAVMTHWVTRFGPRTYEYDAEIVEQVPDRLVRWNVLDKPRHAGTATFEELGTGRCRVTLRVDLRSRGLLKRTAAAPGLARRVVHTALTSFKEFTEGQGRETGAWRGEISRGHVQPTEGRSRPHVPTWPTG
ncbi:SRPBCC family protein [Streptomyces sp. KMM 9044]|uniref:SRPBCC family protein n=1 Tax=Streptomyces sp. KMM 9044 TaxID=2744474 RepID=UPI0021517D5E|nr:SRPBCC family protein [Streptomyces sp. KMM 9044]WAX81445.1 SRPBCC family protein [Streptomyces sp. KMM 9044]